jgi:3-dehydroquinate dehydratase-2
MIGRARRRPEEDDVGQEHSPGRPGLSVVPTGPGEASVLRNDAEPLAGTVLLLSGPNLSLLGERQPEVYGYQSLDDHVATATRAAAEHGLSLEHVQSEYEGALVEAVHGARRRVAAIVVNAGALTHYSWALHDALAAFEGPVVELHLSHPGRREPWRHLSVVTPVATGVIAGFGGEGYRLAIEAVASLLRARHA